MPHVLIVDDSPSDRAIAGRHLERLPDMRLSYADSGERAITMMECDLPDVIVTDMRMPEMDGLELVQHLRKSHPSVPVIVMTSYGNEQTAVEALQAGAAGYVSKRSLEDYLPNTIERLWSMVDRDQRHREAIGCLTASETFFELASDAQLIASVIEQLKQNIRRLDLFDNINRTRIGIALQEVLDNALYHGNLELDSELRENGFNDYFELARQRALEVPYNERRIHIIARESRDGVEYIVRDDGPGFDPDALPDPTAPENMERLTGRGLLLVRTFMDRVEYNESGNQITIAKATPGGNGASSTVSASPVRVAR